MATSLSQKRLGVESLEARLMMASVEWEPRYDTDTGEWVRQPSLTATIEGGNLKLEGTDRPDEVTIRHRRGDGQEQGGVRAYDVAGVFLEQGADYLEIWHSDGIPGHQRWRGWIKDSEVNDFVFHGHAGKDYFQYVETTLDGLPAGEDSRRPDRRIIALGGAGDDTLHGFMANDVLFGGEDRDWIRGQDGDDLIFGEEGDDVLYGNAGHDMLFGGIDADFLDGGPDEDELYGTDLFDLVDGAKDTLMGGAGVDTLHAEAIGECTCGALEMVPFDLVSNEASQNPDKIVFYPQAVATQEEHETIQENFKTQPRSSLESLARKTAVYYGVGGPEVGRMGDDGYWMGPTDAGEYVIGVMGPHRSTVRYRKWSNVANGTEMRLINDAPQVKVGGVWQPLSRFSDVTVDEIRERTKTLYEGIIQLAIPGFSLAPGYFPSTWIFNDFGHKAVKYFKDLDDDFVKDSNEEMSGEFIHATPVGEVIEDIVKEGWLTVDQLQQAVAKNGVNSYRDYPLTESHGCVHMRAFDLDHLIANYLKVGMQFVVHDYSEKEVPELVPFPDSPNYRHNVVVHFFPGAQRIVVYTRPEGCEATGGDQSGSALPSWHNAENPADVDQSGSADLSDLLMMVSWLRNYPPGPLPDPANEPTAERIDVNADGAATLADLLEIVGVLRESRTAPAAGEGEPLDAMAPDSQSLLLATSSGESEVLARPFAVEGFGFRRTAGKDRPLDRGGP